VALFAGRGDEIGNLGPVSDCDLAGRTVRGRAGARATWISAVGDRSGRWIDLDPSVTVRNTVPSRWNASRVYRGWPQTIRGEGTRRRAYTHSRCAGRPRGRRPHVGRHHSVGVRYGRCARARWLSPASGKCSGKPHA